MEVHTVLSSQQSQLYPVDGINSCIFFFRMHPAIFSDEIKNITFVSQGAHWRTDAHNGQAILYDLSCFVIEVSSSVETSSACVPFLWVNCGLRHEHLPLSVFLAERNLL